MKHVKCLEGAPRSITLYDVKSVLALRGNGVSIKAWHMFTAKDDVDQRLHDLAKEGPPRAGNKFNVDV